MTFCHSSPSQLRQFTHQIESTFIVTQGLLWPHSNFFSRCLSSGSLPLALHPGHVWYIHLNQYCFKNHLLFPLHNMWLHTSLEMKPFPFHSFSKICSFFKTLRPWPLSHNWPHPSMGRHWPVLLHMFLPFSHCNVTLCLFRCLEDKKPIFSLL